MVKKLWGFKNKKNQITEKEPKLGGQAPSSIAAFPIIYCRNFKKLLLHSRLFLAAIPMIYCCTIDYLLLNS